MAIKPTYEELAQRIKELESRLEQREETLRLLNSGFSALKFSDYFQASSYFQIKLSGAEELSEPRIYQLKWPNNCLSI